MYVPKHFEMESREAAFELMRHNGFALLVSAGQGGAGQGGMGLTASHLPLLLDAERGPQGTLIGHFARANGQWRDLFGGEAGEGAEVLAIFQGSHSYLSPDWYGPSAQGRTVPTWLYEAVHAYGKPREITDSEQVKRHLAEMSTTFEAAYGGQWSLGRIEDDLVEKMMRGIVFFELEITRLEAKSKLSQNKSEEQRRHAAEILLGRKDRDSRILGQAMLETLSDTAGQKEPV